MDKETYEAIQNILTGAHPDKIDGGELYHKAWDRVMSWMSEYEKEFCE